MKKFTLMHSDNLQLFNLNKGSNKIFKKLREAAFYNNKNFAPAVAKAGFYKIKTFSKLKKLLREATSRQFRGYFEQTQFSKPQLRKTAFNLDEKFFKFLNFIKIGLLLGFFVDAFKVGS